MRRPVNATLSCVKRLRGLSVCDARSRFESPRFEGVVLGTYHNLPVSTHYKPPSPPLKFMIEPIARQQPDRR